MKTLAIGCSLLALVACSSTTQPLIPPSSSAGTGSSTGAPTASAAGTTGSSAGSSTGSSTGPGTTGSATGGRSSTGSSAGSSTGSSTGNGTTTGSYIGLPCTFNTMTGADSCQPYGYECSLLYDTTDPGTCGLPQEIAQCLADVGCQDGGNPELVCSPGFSNNGKNIDICAYPCTTTNDCTSIFEDCLPGTDVCFNDYCDRSAAGKFSGPYFNRCTVDDGGDTGQCFSFNNGTVAYCLQSGFDFTDEACNPNGRTGGDSECDFGDFCMPNVSQIQKAGDVADGGFCLPITIDGGCPDGYDAFKWYNDADWSVCAQDCTETGVCTVGTCYSDGALGLNICLPP